ncbi:hypothetical protein NHX12_009078 [Muraenolepis orangiensis]|uniref:Uncharacterized protein n=1 Tax=Muraenolepis orangiensis TaxID=630683 RepID=A0A9Q0IBU8_9TELE|nr:hypothetical protein NHX12_009078 [Muraenolepis orangiensis]
MMSAVGTYGLTKVRPLARAHTPSAEATSESTVPRGKSLDNVGFAVFDGHQWAVSLHSVLCNPAGRPERAEAEVLHIWNTTPGLIHYSQGLEVQAPCRLQAMSLIFSSIDQPNLSPQAADLFSCTMGEASENPIKMQIHDQSISILMTLSVS